MTAPNPQAGILSVGDALVTHTADGVDLTSLWNELTEAWDAANAQRSAISNLLSYPTTDSAAIVPQNIMPPEFELASELGVPKSIGTPADTLVLGARLLDFDLAHRASWRYLRAASADQVRATMNSVLEADTRNINGTLMFRLFNPAQEKNEWQQPCYSIWNGADGIAPPPWLGKSFDTDHTHFIPTGADQIDSDDLESGFRTVTEHGYGLKENGNQLLVFCNEAESEFIQSFRAGEVSRTSGPTAKFSFIPSVAAPPYLSPDFVIGEPAPAQFGGLDVVGSYGPAYIIETTYVPAGYLAIVATGGPGALNNALSFRQHENPNYQGSRLIPGPNASYPITESFSARSFGTGTRHRGAAAVLQVTTDEDYSPPAKTAFGIRQPNGTQSPPRHATGWPAVIDRLTARAGCVRGCRDVAGVHVRSARRRAPQCETVGIQ